MKLHIKTLLAAFFALAMAFAVQAQTTGSVTGTITDPNGAVVPAAKVTLTNQATRAELTATTNDAGGFNFTALQPGAYTVSVTASGFKRTQVPNVTVEVSKPTQLSIPLTIGIEGETVTPMLLARRFTLNPVLVIISLVFWFWMWGIPGVILAVPMLAITKIICDRLKPLAAFGHFLEG